MKTGLLLLPALLLSLNVYGQGSVTFANSQSTPVTNVHTGQRVPAGSTFKAALYVAPDGTTDDSQYTAVAGDTTFFVPGVFSFVVHSIICA